VTANARRDAQVLAAIGAAYTLLTLRFAWVCDDAFISFRYAKNWAAGHGLRYNLGDALPVEGYSNFLWTALAAVAERLGLPPVLCMPIVSFACGLAVLALLFVTLRRRAGLDRLPASLAVGLVAVFPPFAVWSTSGLETMPFVLLMLVVFERLIARRAGPAMIAGAAAGLGLALIRVDGLAWAVLLGATAALFRWRDRTARRRIAGYLAIVLAGFAIYFAARYAYYQRPFANTVYAKVGFSAPVFVRGVKYVAMFVATFLTPLALLPAGWLADRQAPRLARPALLLILATIAYAIAIGGDFMAMGRMLIPAVVFGGLLAGLAFHRLIATGTANAPRHIVIAAAVLGLLGLLPAWNLHLVPRVARVPLNFRLREHKRFLTEFEQWEEMRRNARQWARYGRTLRTLYAPSDTCVFGAVGAIGYYSGLYIYDTNGLITPELTAGRAPHAALRSPGHDAFRPWTEFLDARPTILRVNHVAGANLRRKVLDHVGRWREQCPEAVRAYAPVLYPMEPLDDAAPGPTYLLVYARIPDGVPPSDAWGAFDQQQRSLPG
jgi:arabinofuranosyltransferase